MGQNLPRLALCQDHWQARLLLRALKVIHPLKVLAQDFPVKKDQRAQRLILRGGCDLLVNGEVVQKLLHLVRALLRRVPLAMKEDVALDPIDIGCFGTNTVVLAADGFAHLIE